MIRTYDSHHRGDCPSERVEQINCMGWLEKNHPDRWPLIFHVANEIKAIPQHMAMRRKMGVKPGVSDILDLGAIRGAFELKRRDKTKCKVSREQLSFLEAIDASGGFSAIVYGYDEFLLAYSDYLVYCSTHSAG